MSFSINKESNVSNFINYYLVQSIIQARSWEDATKPMPWKAKNSSQLRSGMFCLCATPLQTIFKKVPPAPSSKSFATLFAPCSAPGHFKKFRLLPSPQLQLFQGGISDFLPHKKLGEKLTKNNRFFVNFQFSVKMYFFFHPPFPPPKLRPC